MKKKYYFNSFSILYLFIMLILIGCLVLCFFADERHSGVIFLLVLFLMCIIVLAFWIVFSSLMRIQVDYNKKELYIIHPYFLKKLKFEDVFSIEIIDYNEVAFDFIIKTKNRTKKLAYSRYCKKRPTAKIIAKVKELKDDLLNISKN